MASSQTLGPINTVTVNGVNYGPRTTVALGSSPATLTNGCSTPIVVLTSIGTVTGIDCSRDSGVTFDASGFLGGPVLFNPNDQLKLTFPVPPTVVFWPI